MTPAAQVRQHWKEQVTCWGSRPWSAAHPGAQALGRWPPAHLHCGRPEQRRVHWCPRRGAQPTLGDTAGRGAGQTPAGLATWALLGPL